MTRPKLWLASSSPRRIQLLESLGLPFEARTSSAEEADLFDGSVEATVIENARRKAEQVASTITDKQSIVIGADTLVAMGNRIMSKPRDKAEAIDNLRRFSGGNHRVLTGLVLVSKEFGSRAVCAQSKVHFRKLTEEEIEHYVGTKEPYDKAGGYAIQGIASLFVEKVEGSFSNVMGLPIEELLIQLKALCGIAPHEWLKK